MILQISFPRALHLSPQKKKNQGEGSRQPGQPGEGSKDRRPHVPCSREAGSDDDLFLKSAKPKPAKKTNPFPLLEDED